MPLPESAFKDPKKFGQHPVSNGPYKFVSWQHNHSIEMVKNPDYKGNRVAKNDGLNFKIYTSPDSAYATYAVATWTSRTRFLTPHLPPSNPTSR